MVVEQQARGLWQKVAAKYSNNLITQQINSNQLFGKKPFFDV